MTEQSKLRTLLLTLWLLLLLPTLFLGYQTYQRLQFEALHQYRTLAETLTDGIASSLSLAVQQESARDPAEYKFALGDARSPLASLTPTSGLPGIVGYFQVDAQGELSSPVMPVGPELVGISIEELALRQLKLVTLENALLLNLPEPALSSVQEPSVQKSREQKPAVQGSPGASNDGLADEDSALHSDRLDSVRVEPKENSLTESYAELVVGSSAAPRAPSVNAQRNQVLYEELSQADKPIVQRRDRQKQSAARELKLETDFFSQSNKEQVQQAAARKLGKAKKMSPSDAKATAAPAAKTAKPKPASESIGSVLRQILPGSAASNDLASSDAALTELELEQTGVAEFGDTKVKPSLFGSTVTEFALRPLSPDHLLLFRRVWQSEQPLVQGLVLDRQQFFAGAVTNAYGDSALVDVSDLAVAVDGQVQLTLAAGSAGYSAGARLSGGELLYRRYLGSPFGNVELLYSARELPLAAGASLVLWTLLVLISLLCAGFVVLYILGKRQLQQRQQQQDFVSAVSHELKTPLTSIRMYGEMLKSGWVDEAKKPEYYDYIFNESERLSRLIGNVLQLSSITRGRSDLQLGPLSVAQILDLVRSRSAAQVKAQGYQLVISCDAALEPAELVVDEDALLQVMINLIDNALKFSHGCERQELLLSVAREGSEIVFSLRDYGPGIEKGQLDKIFELFYRSENELTRETVGTGIGLALVQELVGAMGGRIAASNCEPGAQFVLRLPG